MGREVVFGFESGAQTEGSGKLTGSFEGEPTTGLLGLKQGELLSNKLKFVAIFFRMVAPVTAGQRLSCPW